MKTMIAVIAVFFSIATQAQDVFDKNSTPEQREQELMNFIKSDIDLYREYRSGMDDLGVAKGWGMASLGFLAVDMLVIMSLNNNDGDSWEDVNNTIGSVVLILVTSLGAAVTGIVGLTFHSKGKSKIRTIMDYAKRGVNKDYGGGLDFQTTSNGLGLVYSF